MDSVNQKKNGNCRSKKSSWFSWDKSRDDDEYRLRENERDFFRQVLMDSGMSRGQIQEMIA